MASRKYVKSFVEVMLHKFRVQYILIDFSDNGFLVVRFVFHLNKTSRSRKSGYYDLAQRWCCLMWEDTPEQSSTN